MSKASEWAAIHQTPRVGLRAQGKDGRGAIDADVTFYGECRLISYPRFQVHADNITLTPDEALALARWILATFSDEPRAGAGA